MNKGIGKVPIVTVLALMLVSIKRRLPRTRKLSSGITTLTLTGIVLLVAVGGASAAPCPAPGDTVITNSCELNTNWTVPAGQAGYIIGADGVTIDGAGYKITGNLTGIDCAGCGAEAPCTVTGIYNDGYDNVVIQNLEIEGFCTGIALKGTQGGNMVRNVTIDNCVVHDKGIDTGSETGTHGIHACWIDVGDGGEPALTITNNEVYNNEGTGSGCGAGGNGVFIVAGGGAKHEKAVISHNNLHDNAKAGFWTKAGLDQSEITYNTAWGNGNGAGITDNTRGGIILKCKASSRNDVSHNDVYDHDTYGYGIFVGGSNNTIEYNNVTNNSVHGISMFRSDGSFNNVLNENTVCDNGVDIHVWSSTAGNHGDENTCDTTSNYDDDGASGCTYPCAGAQPYYCDGDGDGYFNVDFSGTSTELPAGCQWGVGDDCNDTNPDVNPGAAENCTDGIDNDCDGLIDGNDPDCLPNKVYFVTEDSGASYCNTTTVEVYADVTDVIQGGSINLSYTPGCANVTDVEYDSMWDLSATWGSGTDGCEWLSFAMTSASGVTGIVHICNLTIHCECDVYCTTPLHFISEAENPSYYCMLSDTTGGEVSDVGWQDGTFTCTNLPDLVITELYGIQQGTGNDYVVNCTVTNEGNAGAAAGHTATLHSGEQATPGVWTLIDDMIIPALAPGESYTGTFSAVLTMTIPNDLMKVCADTGGDVMELDETNNCMESFYPAGIEIKVDVLDGGECVDFQEQFLVNITVDPRNIETYGIQYTLSFNNEVLHAEWQNEGTFLNSDGMPTNMYINNINNGAGTISFAATRVGDVGGVTAAGTLAVIKFTAIQQGGSSNLTLSGVIAANNIGGKILPLDLINDSVCVWENEQPVVLGKSMFMYNNDGQKYLSTAYFNGTDSYDPDGEVIYWRWSFGDGEYGTGDMKDHIYRSWKWNGSGYDPFTVSLTVTDDGDPHELDNTTFFDVIVYTAGDTNGDGEVDILDATIVGLEWDHEANFNGDLYWHDNPRGDMADLNNDGIVDILDAVIVGTCWGHTAW